MSKIIQIPCMMSRCGSKYLRSVRFSYYISPWKSFEFSIIVPAEQCFLENGRSITDKIPLSTDSIAEHPGIFEVEASKIKDEYTLKFHDKLDDIKLMVSSSVLEFWANEVERIQVVFNKHEKMNNCKEIVYGDPMVCEHANESPHICPCNEDCYCRRPGGSCRNKSLKKSRE